MGNTTENFSKSLEVVKPEEDFSAELKDLHTEIKKIPTKEKPMYLSNKVIGDRATYINKQWKKSFEEMYGKTQPQEFNGQKVGKYTKIDVERINYELKYRNNYYTRGEERSKEITKEKNDLDGFRDRTDLMLQDVQKFLGEAKAKLDKYDKLNNTFSAPIDGKVVSVQYIPERITTYRVEGYVDSQASRIYWLEITIDDQKSWTKVVCDIDFWYKKTWQYTTDDYFRYSMKVNDVATNPTETHNLDDDSYAEKHKPRETLNKILWLAERVIPQCPNIIDNEVKKYSAQIKTDQIIKQGEEGKKIQENIKEEKRRKAAEGRLKNVIGW